MYVLLLQHLQSIPIVPDKTLINNATFKTSFIENEHSEIASDINNMEPILLL